MREKAGQLSGYKVEGHRMCIISFNLKQAKEILNVLDAWHVDILLVGTAFVYQQVKAFMSNVETRIQFRLLKNIQCITLDRDIAAFSPHYLLSYGCYKKIPDSIINSVQSLAVNFHPSLLPLYKGANPYCLPIENQDEFFGVSVHKLTSEFDCGDILLQLKVKMTPAMTESQLNAQYSYLMHKAFIDFLCKLDSGEVIVQPNPKGYPLAPSRRNKDFYFNPELSAQELERFVRARNMSISLPYALVTGRSVLSIQEVSLCEDIDDIPKAKDLIVGDLLFIRNKALLCCGQGYLWITVVFQTDKSSMSIERYRYYEGLQDGDQIKLRDPCSAPNIAVSADDIATWYIEHNNRCLGM